MSCVAAPSTVPSPYGYPTGNSRGQYNAGQQQRGAEVVNPVALQFPERPLIGVGSYLVMDTKSKKIFAHAAANQPRPIASLTKIATAMVALDWQAATGVSFNTLMRVPESVRTVGGASALRLQPGDEITLRDALYGALLSSDNACAQSIADFVGRDLAVRQGVVADPVSHFVSQMNALATQLKMKRSNFVNPHGLDGLDAAGNELPAGKSTAADIARLSVYAMENSGFRFYVSQKSRDVSVRRALNGGKSNRLALRNTNELVGAGGVDGVKTGTTSLAGPCLVASAAAPPVIDQVGERKRVTPRRMLVVLLNSQDRFSTANHLLQNSMRQYDAWFKTNMIIHSNGELLTDF